MKEIMVVGYVEIDGIRTFSDEVMKIVWEQIQKDGVAKTVFNIESIKNSDDFVHYMKQPTVLPALIIVDEEIAGLGWLANMERNYAFGNYVFFKKWWGRKTLSMGKALIKYWFDFKKDDEPLIDVVIGQTPKNNQRACKFIQKIGLTVVGTIPFMDDGDDMLISYATRKGLNYG